MALHTKNIAPTDLSTAYPREYDIDIEPGTLYTDPNSYNSTYVWGVYDKGTGGLTCGANVVCVPKPSTTNQFLFTADFSDTDAEIKQDAVFPVAAVTHGNRCWFKCKGLHTIQQRLTATTPAQYDVFAPVNDKAMYTSTTPYQSTGYFLENPGVTASKTRKVELWGRRYS